MDKGYKNRVSRNTRDDLDSMIDRGMRQLERKARLSGGLKKAGVITGIATAGIGTLFGLVYLAKSLMPASPQTFVEQNNGSMYSSFLMINRTEEIEEKKEVIEYSMPEQEKDFGERATDVMVFLSTMGGLVSFETSVEANAPAAFEELYTKEPESATQNPPAAIETPIPTPNAIITTPYATENTPEAAPIKLDNLPEPEDMFSVWLSKATLYNGSYGALVEGINDISKSSGTISYAQLHDENNTLVVEYEGVGYPETFPIDESTVDSLIAETQGLRQESIHISGTELERLMEKNNSSLSKLASHISEYCSGSYEPSIIESYLANAQLVNFVPRNSEFPLINIITPSEVYTFYAKGNENMQTLMDLAGIPK